jgi:hypothetical protein
MQLSFQHGTPTAPPGILAQRIRMGMGQTQSTTAGTVSSLVAAGASATTGILGTLAAVAAGTSVAGPIGLAVTALVTIGVLLMKVFSGCGQTCVEATDIANQVEPVLLQNLQQYLAAPVHYASLQAAALNNFNTAWQGLVQGCGSGALATTQAGENCIANRQQGSCAYKTSPGGWQQDASGNWSYVYPGANGSGTACWDWFIGYHDPIANDPTVVPDPVAGTSSSSSSASSSTTGTAAGSFPWPLLIVAAVVAWAMEEA